MASARSIRSENGEERKSLSVEDSSQSSESKMGRLGKEVYDFISKPSNGDEEVKEIEQSIRSAVCKVLDEVVKLDPRLKHKLICSGSFYDGLRIESADEFDYIVELTELSSAKLEIREVPRMPGFSSVKVTDSALAQSWKTVLTEDEQVNVSKLQETFKEVVNKVLLKQVLKLPSNLSFDSPPFKDTRVGLEFSFVWSPPTGKNRKISVDLVPTIKLPGWPAVSDFPSRVKGYSTEAQKIAEPAMHLGYNLVPYFVRANHTTWRISFSVIESHLVRGICQTSHYVHRDVLHSLKFLYNTYGQEWFPVNIISNGVGSYVMKTSFFKEWEQYSANSQWTGDKFAERIISTLKRIQREMNNEGVRNFFVKDYKVASPPNRQQKRNCLPDCSLPVIIQKMEKIRKGQTSRGTDIFLAAILRLA